MSTATIHGLWIDSFTHIYTHSWGFPGSSAGKESTCNVGDPVLIPGSGRSPGKGLGYLLQDSWASLVAQMVKNLPAMQEAWVRSLDWEDPLEEGMATHSSILTWRIPWTEEPGGLQSMGLQRIGYDWVTKHTHAYSWPLPRGRVGVLTFWATENLHVIYTEPSVYSGPLYFHFRVGRFNQRSSLSYSSIYYQENPVGWTGRPGSTYIHSHVSDAWWAPAVWLRSSAQCSHDPEGWGWRCGVGGSSQREWIRVYIWLIHFIVQQELTHHGKTIIFQ